MSGIPDSLPWQSNKVLYEFAYRIILTIGGCPVSGPGDNSIISSLTREHAVLLATVGTRKQSANHMYMYVHISRYIPRVHFRQGPSLRIHLGEICPERQDSSPQ